MNSWPFFFVFQKNSSAGWQKGVRVKSELKRMEKILLNTGVESKCQYFFSKQRYLLFMGVQQASKTEWSLRFNTASGFSSVCLLQIKVLLLRSIPSSVFVTFLTLICFWGSFALILRTKNNGFAPPFSCIHLSSTRQPGVRKGECKKGIYESAAWLENSL